MQKSNDIKKLARKVLAFSICCFLIFFVACSSDSDDLNQSADGDQESDSIDTENEIDSETSNEEEKEINWPDKIDKDINPSDMTLEPNKPHDLTLPDGIKVRVGTYNIYGGKFASAEKIGAYLKELDLDIVGLQECPENFIDKVAKAGDFPYFKGKTLLSKTELTNFEEKPLKSGRSFAYAETELGGQTFSVYDAHLGWNVEGNVQCREFVDEYLSKDQNKHLILVGDFNDENLSTQISMLNEVVLDAATKMGWFSGKRISWPSTGFFDTEGAQLIDLVFFRKDFQPIIVDVQVLNQSPVLSDHKPVIAELLYPKNPDTPFSESDDPYTDIRDIWKDFPEESNMPENLLKNAGAEDGLDGWEANGNAMAITSRDHNTAYKGDKFFIGFEEQNKAETPQSYAFQVVDLTDKTAIIDAGKAKAYVSAYMATGYNIVKGEAGTPNEGVESNMARPYDDGEVIIEFLDDAKEILLRKTSSRRDPLKYQAFASVLDVPIGSRSAKYTWMSHHNTHNGPDNDAMFDDLYLGVDENENGNTLLDGNLLKNPGAEKGDLSSWTSDGWSLADDYQAIGIDIFFPFSSSGKFMFYSGSELGGSSISKGGEIISQEFSIDAYREEILNGDFALRWGAKVRTYIAKSTITIRLEIMEGDEVWGTYETDAIFDAEWVKTEMLTKIPVGASKIRYSVISKVAEDGRGAFFDQAFVLPERIKASE